MSVHTSDPPPTVRDASALPVSTLLHRSLLHKRASAEVLVGEPRRTDDGVVFVVELPPTHSTVRRGSSRVPTILLLEAVRQLGIATAHCLLQAPLGWAFIANAMSLHWLVDPIAFPSYGPVELDAQVRADGVTTRYGVPCGLTAEARLDQDGCTVAHAAGRLSFVPPTAYRAIRRHAHLPSSRDTRTDPEPLRNVQRTEGRLAAQVGWNWCDRFYFDHDTDHVPGMVLAAAVCQAQHSLSEDREPAGLCMEFDRYAELDTPVDLAAHVTNGSPRSILVTLTQAGDAIGHAEFAL